MNEYTLLYAIGEAEDEFLLPLMEQGGEMPRKTRGFRRVIRTAALVAALALGLFLTAFAVSPDFRAEVIQWIAGEPQGSYSPFDIVPAVGEPVVITGEYTPVFINGTFAWNVQTETRDGTVFGPLREVALALGAQVREDGETVTAVLGGNTLSFTMDKTSALCNGQQEALPGAPYLSGERLYVPLRFLAEGLGAEMVETPALKEPTEFWMDTGMPISPVETIVRDFDNILIDLPWTDEGLTAEQAAQRAVQVCTAALETFREGLPEHLADTAEDVARDIDNMRYLGPVSCYHKLTMGPYDILVDRYTQRVFFVIPQMAATIVEVDENDPNMYVPIYVAG